jgi:hypothetical protein
LPDLEWARYRRDECGSPLYFQRGTIMPSWWQVAIPVVVALMAVALAAWINIHIKFAPTREAAIDGLQRGALRIFGWVMNAVTVGLLIWQVFSSAPVTRLAVFLIAFQVAAMTLVLVSAWSLS